VPEAPDFKHETDRAYAERVRTALINGVKEARAKLAPARLGVGTGVSLANVNRLGRDVDGRIVGGANNPDGAVDRQIGLIRLERPDGSPVALIANYAMHGTVLGPENLQISGDAPGIVASYVEQKLGAPMLFINGAAGNLNTIYRGEDFSRTNITQFNVLLGDKILAANRRVIANTTDVRLRAAEKLLETPRRPGLGWPESLGKYQRITSGGTTVVRLPIRFLIVGDELAIWSLPVELFCEIAMDLRTRSPFPYTFYFGYTNGWLGYLPNSEGMAVKGYSSSTAGRKSPFTPQVEEDLTQAVTAFLDGLGRP
jgi:hypothetical protein